VGAAFLLVIVEVDAEMDKETMTMFLTSYCCCLSYHLVRKWQATMTKKKMLLVLLLLLNCSFCMGGERGEQ